MSEWNMIVTPIWAKWAIGDPVEKTKGSNWSGKVVGYYSTGLTEKGYAVESDTETGSVQIYPEAALRSKETEAEREKREMLEIVDAKCNEYNINIDCSAAMRIVCDVLFDAGYRKERK